MSQFRIKKIDLGVPDEWVLRTNDDGATLGDDIVAEDPNDLSAAILDTQTLLLKASVYAPSALLNPASGVLERVKLLEDNVGHTTLQDAYVNGNYINPVPGQNLILGAGGVVEIDSNGNLMINSTTMKVYSGSQQIDFTKNSITTSTTDFTVGTTGATRTLNLVAGNEFNLKDKYLTAPVRLSQPGNSALITTAQSLVGAINELKSGAASASLQQIYSQSSPPRITTTVAGGKVIIENGTGNSLTPALEIIGNEVVSGNIKAETMTVGSGLGGTLTIAATGAVTTASFVKATEFQAPSVKSLVGSLVLSDVFGSAALTSVTDPVLLTTKQTIFGAINELKTAGTASASTTAAFAVQHDSATGNHKIITTRADSGQNNTDRILVKDDGGVDRIRMNGAGQIRATNFILPTYDLATETAANNAHRNGDGSDHAAVAAHFAAANPHNTVRRLNVQGSPTLSGDIILKPGPGTTLTQVGQEIEISAAAGSTLQGVYEGQPTGTWTIHAGKELYLKNDLNVDIASFQQNGSFFGQNINMLGGAGIASTSNLTVSTTANLNLSSSNSDVSLSTPNGSVQIQGVAFAPAGVSTLAPYLGGTFFEAVDADLKDKYSFHVNPSNDTILKGTPVSVNYDNTLWTPQATTSLLIDELWLAAVAGIADEDIAPGATGRIKSAGKMSANIGEMDATAAGEFQIGDILYVSRGGYAEVEFTALPANNNTITIAGATYTAKLVGAAPSLGQFQITNTGSSAEQIHVTMEALVDTINTYDFAGLSLKAFLGGTRAYADVVLTGAGSVGDTFTIGAVAEAGSQAVTLTAVATKTASNQYLIGPSASATAKNLADAINATSRKRTDNTNGHFCYAVATGDTIRITRRAKGTIGNLTTISETSAAITAPANLSGGRTFAKVTLLNRNAAGKTVATNNAASIRVAGFSADESSSHYIASRIMFEDTRPVGDEDKLIKVGKIVATNGSELVFNIEIEDKDVFKV